MTTSDPPLVLVAEDEDSVRAMLGVVLRAAGFDSILCTDGRDALNRLEAGLRPDIVLLDIRMPRLGGVELTRAIRSEPRWDAIPLVAMSAYSDQLQHQQIVEAGANAFLPKPFTIGVLREVLGGLLAVPPGSGVSAVPGSSRRGSVPADDEGASPASDRTRPLPLAHAEVTAAADCLARGQAPEAVHHCLGAVLVMLGAVARDLGDPTIDAHEDATWVSIVEPFERELARLPENRSAAWRARGPLYEAVTEGLQVLGASWRSATLRPTVNYSREQAEVIWRQTWALLELLAAETIEPEPPLGFPHQP